MDKTGNLRRANQARAATGRTSAASITAALDTLRQRGIRLTPAQIQAVRLRLDHPRATAAELAALAGPTFTKNAIFGHLRRIAVAGGR